VRDGNARITSNTRIFVKIIDSYQLPPILLLSTMPPSDQHEEEKVLAALDLIRKNPGIKVAEAARTTRVLYYRVIRRLNEVPRSSS
jgi:hypothetical protein